MNYHNLLYVDVPEGLFRYEENWLNIERACATWGIDRRTVRRWFTEYRQQLGIRWAVLIYHDGGHVISVKTEEVCSVAVKRPVLHQGRRGLVSEGEI